MHVGTGLKDTAGDGLDSQLDFSFDTFGPGIGPSELNANGDFSGGMRNWRPEIQGNEGNSSVYWAKEPGSETPTIVLKRTDTSDGGQTGLYQSYLGIEQGYSLEVTVTYKRISGSTTGDHRLQVLAWYGSQGDEFASNTGFGGGYLDADESIDSDWVTATATFYFDGPRLGAIWITQGGHEFGLFQQSGMMFRSLAIIAFFLCSSMLSGRGMPFVDAGRQVVNVNTDRLTRATLTIVTFNMLHGYGSRLNDSTLEERLELLAAGIAEAKPDVVFLQEASVTPGRHGNVAERLRDALNERLRGEEISYNSVFAMANGSRLIGFFEGSAILSRFQILSADSLVYAAQALIPPERRIALRARVATGGETGEAGARSIEIIGTHLTNTEARKRGG